MNTTFTNCTFRAVDNIPDKNKGGKFENATGKNYDNRTFLVEKGNPAIFYRVPDKLIQPKLTLLQRFLNWL